MRRAVALAAALLLAACGGGGGDDGPVTLTLLTHDSFAVSEGVLEAFTAETGIAVEVARGQDAGLLLNRAILTKDDPEGDVLWGVDNTLASRALDEGIFVPYRPAVVDELGFGDLSPSDALTPVDRGYVCVNADRRWFSRQLLPVPATLDDLADPRYRDLLVVQDPSTSSPGLAFLLATIGRFGDGWQDYWQRLVDNGVKVVDGWTTAYTVEFSGSSGQGPRPLVVSYSTSPAAEVVFAADRPVDAPTMSLDGCFEQVEYAGILAGTRQEEEARRLVDFLVSTRFQEDMPLTMFVYPARPDAALPAEFTTFAPEPATTYGVPADLDERREAWIDEWTNLVLR